MKLKDGLKTKKDWKLTGVTIGYVFSVGAGSI
jgi:hypothetical protein